ncbi:mevalonate kinase [Streptococcus pacificus]|uniref:Mevalonate kinase n=1 Tax=Streptococcus pacificus TaxID=2740577 RepID=A0ABS0ZI52_9STRE|nr:mevalonate kinase [Streptococcus pacificus]MBJ8325671.1 mevalonate kinase [Streptococcus pacificus]
MKTEIGIGKSHSKIILIGEHSVVYGYPAIALPLKNIEVVCQITPSKNLFQFKKNDTLSTAIFSALDYLKIREPYIDYHIVSGVPEKRGMGSSAAVSIAAIRAVFDYYHQTVDDATLELLTNQAEIIAHVNPSGLDAKTCLSDEAIKFIRNVGFSTLPIDLDAFLVIADTGIQGHTREAVKKVESLENKAIPHLKKLGKLTTAIEKAIASKDIFKIGQSMTTAHSCLKELGVSSNNSDHLVNVALKNDALGSKMTGGGLGGCIIAICQTKEEADKISYQLEKEGAIKTWIEAL